MIGDSIIYDSRLDKKGGRKFGLGQVDLYGK